MANNTKIRGITIELSADTQGISDGLKEVRSSLSQTQKSLKDVDKLLKFNPSNTDLLKQKQEYLGKAVQDTRKKLEEEKQLLEQLQNAGNSDKTREQQNALQREIIETTNKLKDLEKQAKDAASVLGTKMQQAGEKLKDVGDKISSVGNKLTVGVTAPIVAAATAAAKFASDYDENLNKVEASFGDAADSVKQWATTATESFGMSESAALELTAQFGDMGTSMGLSNEEAAQMSTSLAGLAGDLASFKNISTDRAMNALTGIFTGQTKALQGLGVVMNEVNLTKFAEDQGKVYKNMTEAEKVMLRYQYVMSRTKNAQGDYARTSDGAANSLRTLKATLENLAVTLGKEVLPLITPLIQKLTAGIKKLNEMDPKTKKLVVTLLGIAAAMGPILSVGGKAVSLVGTVVKDVGKLITAMAGQKVATDAATASQSKFNLSLLANPIVAVTAAIIAAIAAITAITYALAKASDESVKFKDNATAIASAAKENSSAVQSMADNAAASIAKMQAQEQVTDELIGTIERLSDKENKSSAEIKELNDAVRKLNDIYPDLNLQYDAAADNLNMTNKELRNNIKLTQNQAKVAAYAKIYNELLAKQTQLQIDQIAIQNQLNAAEQEHGDLIEKASSRGAANILYMDEAKSAKYAADGVKELGNALTENERAQASSAAQMEVITQEMASMGITVDPVTGTFEEFSEAVDEATDSMEESNNAITESTNRLQYEQTVHDTFAQAVIKSYHDLRDAVVNSIETQISWLDKYEAAQTVSASEIEKNLTEQIKGVEEWQTNLVKLADMGINQGLLKYLMDMGPKGAGYVRGLVEGGADELSKINKLWEEAMGVETLATETGEELKGVIQDLIPGFEDLGYQTGAGFARGMNKAQTLVNNAASAMTRAAVDTGRNVLGIASPSKVFAWIGEMTGLGFEQGLKNSFGAADKWLSTELSSFSQPGIDNAAIYNAIRSGAGDASINVYLDDRELTRGLKGLGVSFA